MNDTPEKKRRGRGCLTIIGGVVVLVIAIAVLAAIVGSGSDDDDENAGDSQTGDGKTQLEEVTISECAADALGDVKITGTAENTSSKRSDYLIELAIESPDGTLLDSPTAIASNVAPDQKAQWEAFSTADFVDGVTCKVVDVERNASL